MEIMEEQEYPEDHFHSFDVSNENLGFDPMEIAKEIFGADKVKEILDVR
jgi:hypothetical protein